MCRFGSRRGRRDGGRGRPPVPEGVRRPGRHDAGSPQGSGAPARPNPISAGARVNGPGGRPGRGLGETPGLNQWVWIFWRGTGVRRPRVRRRGGTRLPGGDGPALAGGTIRGARERVADLERDVSGTSTAVGVNGDFTSSTDGHANGIVVSGAYQHGPSPARSSVAIDPTGRAANVTLRLETTLGSVVATSHPHRSTAGRGCSPGTATPRTGRPPPRRLRRPRHGRRPGWDH